VYQIGINKGIILRCTAYQISRSLYMFRKVFPSIIRSLRLYIKHQVFVIHASGYVPASMQSTNLYDKTDAVCTALNSRWWTERPSETCRVIFNKLENCASSWLCYGNISQCTVPWTSNRIGGIQTCSVRFFLSMKMRPLVTLISSIHSSIPAVYDLRKLVYHLKFKWTTYFLYIHL
jgi:hypothetical protein